MLRLIKNEVLIKQTNKKMNELIRCYLLNLHMEEIKPGGGTLAIFHL